MTHAQTQERPAFILEVVRMDYTQGARRFSSHSQFEVWQFIESPSRRVVYSVTFTDASKLPIGPFDYASLATLAALKTIGELKTS